MSTSGDAENLASDLQHGSSLSGPGTVTKPPHLRRRNERIPLQVSNTILYAHKTQTSGESPETVEAQGVSSNDSPEVSPSEAQYECEGSSQVNPDFSFYRDHLHSGAISGDAYWCSTRGQDHTTMSMNTSETGSENHRLVSSPDCLGESSCGDSSLSSSTDCLSHGAQRPTEGRAGPVDTQSITYSDADVSLPVRTEGGDDVQESWADISANDLISQYSLKKDVDLIKAKALTQHFQKLKGDLVEAFADRKEAPQLELGLEKSQVENVAHHTDFLGQSWGEGKQEIKLSRLLCEQLKILAEREKAVERRLSMERMEHIVDKVEEEVELEAAMEELLLRMKADEEVMEMQRQEREWEIERREVQYEEQIMMLQSRVKKLAEEVSITQAEKEYALQKKQEEMDEVIRGMLVELREGEEDLTRSKDTMRNNCRALDLVQVSTPNKGSSPSKDLFIAFEELLKEADERTEKERKCLEDVTIEKQESEECFHHERRRWRENDKQNECRILALEKEVSRFSSVLRETERALLSERERRKESRLEMDRTMDIWRGETKRQLVMSEKMRRLESFLMKVKKTVSNVLQSASALNGNWDASRSLQVLLEDPDVKIEEGYVEVIVAPEGDEELNCSVAAHLTQLKADRDRVEAERDKLEENLTIVMHKAREREKELEGVWLEREKTLIAKLSIVEAKSEELELQCRTRETVMSQERRKWEQEMESWKKKWVNEKHGWEAMVREREQWVDAQVEKWSCLLQEKEAELVSMKEKQSTLTETLEANRQRMREMKQQMVTTRKGFQREYPRRGSPWFEDNEESCNSSEVSSAVPKMQGESSSQNFIDVERLAIEMEAEIRRLTKEVRIKEERLAKEKLEMMSATEQLKQDRQALEQKVFETQSVVESLKAEIRAKEMHLETEQKKMEEALAMKVSEIRKLESQLDFGEHEMELGEQQFKEELRLLSRQVERERKCKEHEMGLNVSLQKKMIEEAKQSEELCSKLNAANQQLGALRADLEQKNVTFKLLEEEAKQKEEQLEFEKRSWIELAKAEELKMAKAISNLMHEKSELFESRHREQAEYQQNVNELRNEILALRAAVQKHEDSEKRSGKEVAAGLMKPDLETLWLDYSENRANVDKRVMEWEIAVEKVADFDQQISDAMLAIQSLRGELSMKEGALVQARIDREAELEQREKAWSQEQQEAAKLQDQLREMDRQRALKEKEELMKLLVAQREDSDAAISALQGAVKELQWSLKHGRRDNLPDFSNVLRISEMVQVHASHLEEVDSFVRAMKLKLEESENQCKVAEGAVRRLEREKAERNADVDAALLQMEKDITRISSDSRGRQPLPSPYQDKGLLSPASRLDGGFENFRKRARASLNMGMYVSRQSEKPMLLTNNGLSSQQDWMAVSSEQFGRSMDMDASSVTSASNTWLPRQGAVEDSWIPEQDRMALSLNSSAPPRRRQQKWLVDAGWLDRVRKEQALLRQQLEIERQRSIAAEQIEAENRWMETAVARALEQKKESDMKVDELQQRVAHLESIMTNRGISGSPTAKSVGVYRTGNMT